jgi:hypothetical protein
VKDVGESDMSAWVCARAGSSFWLAEGLAGGLED